MKKASKLSEKITKLVALLLALTLTAAFAACGKAPADKPEVTEAPRKQPPSRRRQPKSPPRHLPRPRLRPRLRPRRPPPPPIQNPAAPLRNCPHRSLTSVSATAKYLTPRATSPFTWKAAKLANIPSTTTTRKSRSKATTVPMISHTSRWILQVSRSFPTLPNLSATV